MSPEMMFSEFKALKFDLNKKKHHKEDEEAPTLSRILAFKAVVEPTTTESNLSNNDIAKMSKEELEDYALYLSNDSTTPTRELQSKTVLQEPWPKI